MATNAYGSDVVVMSVISCVLSIVGGIVIIITYVILPEIRNFPRKLILCLTVADLLTSSGYLLSTTNYLSKLSDSDTDRYVCRIQSSVTTYSSLVSFFLTSIIAIYLFDTITHRQCRLGTRKWLLSFNVLSWGIPGIIIGAGWSKDVFGEDKTTTGGTGPWCWIKIDNSSTTKSEVFWMVLTGKGWEISCYIITTSLYILLKVRLWMHYRLTKFHQIHVSLRREDRNFLLVPLLLYLIRLWGTTRFLIYVIWQPSSSELYMKILLHFQALGDPAQAFCNFILFCIGDRTIRRKIFPFTCTCKRIDILEDHLIDEEISRKDSLNADDIN